jgi:hypothetical protein
MKFIAVVFLMLGMLCSSTLAIAEGPVPFADFMQTAGAQPTVPSSPDAQAKPVAATAQTPHTHMTRGGKIETGIGVGLLGLGVMFIAAGASVRNGEWLASETRAVGLGGGAIFAGAGTTLVVLGCHRRK